VGGGAHVLVLLVGEDVDTDHVHLREEGEPLITRFLNAAHNKPRAKL